MLLYQTGLVIMMLLRNLMKGEGKKSGEKGLRGMGQSGGN